LSAISLVVLLAAIVALYLRKLEGVWRGIYVVTAMLALYLTPSRRWCRRSTNCRP
jgi:hypothetical protein